MVSTIDFTYFGDQIWDDLVNLLDVEVISWTTADVQTKLSKSHNILSVIAVKFEIDQLTIF